MLDVSSAFKHKFTPILKKNIDYIFVCLFE